MRRCYGKMDSNIAINFPYNCNKCRYKNRCFQQTLYNMRKALKDRYGE